MCSRCAFDACGRSVASAGRPSALQARALPKTSARGPVCENGGFFGGMGNGLGNHYTSSEYMLIYVSKDYNAVADCLDPHTHAIECLKGPETECLSLWSSSSRGNPFSML